MSRRSCLARLTSARPLVQILSALAALCAIGLSLAPTYARADDNTQISIVLASTSSTQASGLYDVLLPEFYRDTGIEVRVIAVGTGRAIQLASRGDADVLLVHHRPSEEQFIADGFGVMRHPLMTNDFVLIGPAAELAPKEDISAWLRKIHHQQRLFVSRGDDSGTHKKERALWQAAQLDPLPHSGTWYRQTGAGMGATLNTAAAMGAFTLSDRSSWLNFKNQRDLVIVSENSDMLNNPYSVILVNPKRFEHVNADAGQRFINWLLSARGQAVIASYRINGQQVFFPNPAP